MNETIIMITKVKNEADIIERFLRYHANIFDHILIIDNGSIDGTYEIISALIHEGLPFEFINEAYSEFDAYRFANQYTRKYVKKWSADMVVLMDADEFLSIDGAENPRILLEGLSQDKVYFCNWKTYVYENNTESSEFCLTAFSGYRSEDGETFTKLIVPGKLILENNIIITEGNHSFKSENKIKIEKLEQIKFCHFPIRSNLQYIKQIIINSIDMLSNTDSMKQTGSHWKKMFVTSGKGYDLHELSLHYAYYEGNEIVKEAFTSPFQVVNRYQSLIKDDLSWIMLKHMELQSLLMKKIKLTNNADLTSKEKIIVFGTGGYCRKMIGRVDERKYSIEAFADSNQEKEFGLFENKIVIAPEWMRFIKFSRIVIASENYVDEIRKQIYKSLPYWDVTMTITIDNLVCNDYARDEI